MRGETYRIIDKYLESIADLERASKIEPDNGDVLIDLGVTYEWMGWYEKSIESLINL